MVHLAFTFPSFAVGVTFHEVGSSYSCLGWLGCSVGYDVIPLGSAGLAVVG